MTATPATVLTPARIVALALVAVLVGGLAYLRFAPDAGAVSVPEGAKAGDLVLEPCEVAAESRTLRADCGTLVVPESRADPQSRLIALPVTRIHARSETQAPPLFRLGGGPGKTNMEFPMASRFADDRDVVLVGYRGVDGSVRLDCPEVEAALKRSTDLLGQSSFRAYGKAHRACAARLTDEGVDLAGYSVVERIDDIEAARKALGYGRIDLVGESAGSRYALVYAWRFPERVHRSVLIAANPPGGFVWDAGTTDEQLRRYAAHCAKDEACSDATDDLAATIGRTNRDIPDRWGFLPIEEGNVRIATFLGLVETSSEAAPISAPMTLQSWTAAEDGDASGFWLMSLLAKLAVPQSFVWGELAALGSADDAAAERHFAAAAGRPETLLGSPGTDFIWGGGELVEAWPGGAGHEYERVRRSDVETLLVGGELDFANPPQLARKELLPHLRNGREVVIPALGHSGAFWTEQPDAGTRLITAFLDGGRVDDSLYRPVTVDFTPTVTQRALAKGIVAGMVGLALLTVVSLPWMALRVRRRGSYGRKAGAALRSVCAVVLGLGGWFAGVLLVLMTMPTVPLDDELLAALSVGAPVGVALYLAWVNRDWSATTKMTGFAAAASGALAGAWLGFHAAEGHIALLTTIPGALAGGNLLLLALDIAWDAQSRERVAAADAAEGMEARASTG